MLTECLKGIRILDLSQYIPGPFATLQLADLGAEVLKVEPPAGDPMRTFGPLDAQGRSAYYQTLNRNKTVVLLDLKDAADADCFTKLVSAADVLLESYRPGTLERLGFGAGRLREINPRLVHCALSGFGQTGPYRSRAGHDITYLACTGSLAVTGTAERPVAAFPPVADHAGAMQAVAAVLAALLRRATTGQGAYLDVSLFESALAWQSVTLERQGGILQRDRGLLNGGAACYRVYRTADGKFMALGALEHKFWRAFCDAAGRPDLVERHSEPLPQAALIDEVERVFAGRPLDEWRRRLDGVDCCAEAVLAPDEVPDFEQVRARGSVKAVEATSYEIPFPCFIDGQPPAARTALREIAAAAAVAAWS